MKHVLGMFGALLIAGAAWAQNPVTFQVHMGIQQQLGNFNPETDLVVVRGEFNGWGGTIPTLTDSGDMLFTGSYDLTDDFLPANHPDPVQYKFVIVSADNGDVWETVDNRTFTLEAGGQTLEPAYFNDITSAGETVNAEILFSVNMEIAVQNGSFDPDTDWIVVRGSHENIGNWGGAVQMSEADGMPDHYELIVQFDGLNTSEDLQYKFVILQDQDENLATWEGVPNRIITPSTDWPDDNENGYLEYMPEEVFFDNVTWDDLLSQDVVVHFMVDLWPVRAWFTDNPGGENQGLTSYDDVNFVGVCGPWNNWPWGIVGPEYQLTNTTGDWYEGDIQFNALSARTISYKYGINGEDNESGFQQDWSQEIDDSTGEFTINNLFGALGELWLDGSVNVDRPAQPAAFELGEAYPNPFNPVTTVPFVLNGAQNVTLKVYNLAGQEVATLASGPMAAGSHSLSFDATSLSSGMYLLSLEGQNDVATRKLMLVK